MSDIESEFSSLFNPLEDKISHFAQTGSLNEPSLSQLRDQIKKVMIPLLIKTFQFKLELNQSLSLPSRLQNAKNQHAPEEVQKQLRVLDNDLKMLLLWCQSCRSQIHKALSAPEEEQKSTIATSSSSASNPAVAKSFNEAVSAQSAFLKQPPNPEEEEPFESDSFRASSQKTWWEKLLGNYNSENDDRDRP